jgi:hypothetical protein
MRSTAGVFEARVSIDGTKCTGAKKTQQQEETDVKLKTGPITAGQHANTELAPRPFEPPRPTREALH